MVVLLALFASAVVGPDVQAADDRDLVLTTGQDPYLFIILDTSGSMKRSVTGGTVQFDAEDVNSKAYIAKSVVYDVVSSLDTRARVGFAHFASPNPKATVKRFCLQGRYRCDRSGGTSLVRRRRLAGGGRPNSVRWCAGCRPRGRVAMARTPRPPTVTLERWVGDGNDTTTLFLHATGGPGVYRVELAGLPVGEELGPALDVEISVTECTGGSTETAIVSFIPFQDVDTAGRPVERADYVHRLLTRQPVRWVGGQLRKRRRCDLVHHLR